MALPSGLGILAVAQGSDDRARQRVHLGMRLLGALGGARWFRASKKSSGGVVGARAREAALAFRTCARKPSTDLADAFAAFVAGCLGCPVRDVMGPDLSTRLVNAGVSGDLASRAGELLDVSVSSRYGERMTEDGIEHACALVDALAANFREHEATRATQA